jgi:hypothetical protein
VTSQLPITVQLWYIRYSATGWFEITANYRETVVGPVTKGQFRRPTSEHTEYNKNIAILQYQYRLHMYMFEYDKATWDGLMAGHGLDVSITSTDPSTPQGFGNFIWETMFQQMTTDGFNALGDDNGRITYNRIPFSDNTGYFPINPPLPHSLIFKDRWQPNLVTPSAPCTQNGNRLYSRVQTFITPQIENTDPMLIPPTEYSNIADWRSPKETFFWPGNPFKYKAKADQVIEATATVTDLQKMISEFFDAKLFSLGLIGDTLFTRYFPNNLDRYTEFEFTINNAVFDTVISVWKAKRNYDQPRPYSVIRENYVSLLGVVRDITSYAGPYQGTKTFPADQWQSYLVSDAHPEYPSGTACVCAVWAEKGSSNVEPGATPAVDTPVFWATLQEMASDCGYSRNWAGVHYLDSIVESRRVCPKFAQKIIENKNKLLNGDATWVNWL